MAYTTIDDPSLYFQIATWTGTGSSNSITLPGDTNMQPDMSWIKSRNSTSSHCINDSARGVSSGNTIHSNNNGAEDTSNTDAVDSFDSDGVTLGADTGNLGVNYSSSQNYVGWFWKGGTTSGITGTADITPSAYSFNTTSGFSVCKYSGVGNAGDTLKTGLSSGIDFYFLKRLDSSSSWSVLGSQSALGAGKYMYLDITDAVASSSAFDNNTAPSSAGVVTLGSNSNVNASGGTHIFYGWKSIQGFSKFGSYTGNNNADGPMIHLGFKPAWFMLKRSDGSAAWYIYDNKRAGYNVDNNHLMASEVDGESTADHLDFLSNGVKLRIAGSGVNNSGANYIYAAFAEAPFVNSEGVPCNAR